MRCDFCPRYCRVDRSSGERGFCRAGPLPEVALVDLHKWEEPPISGIRGAGTVFFAKCNLRCVFCQNNKISQGEVTGEELTPLELAHLFLKIERQGAHNVDLVSPTHFAGPIAEAIRLSRKMGLTIPFVYNTGGYDSLETLARLDGLVDVYLPDLKYVSSEISSRYGATGDYFEHASKAILEMSRQVGPPKFTRDGIMQRGLIVRHLVLPGCVEDTRKVLKWIKDNLPYGTFISLMSQYYPCHRASEFPEINRVLTSDEYDAVLEEMERLELGYGFFQELSSAEPAYTPDFEGRARRR